MFDVNYLLTDTLPVLIQIVLSLACGFLIGMERSKAKRSAGMRTYMLVCLGSTVVMITGQYIFDKNNQLGDPARLAAQVISGIGFLGAGTIISSGEQRVRGLTTAAGLWATACIGIAIGTKLYSVAVLSTLAIYIVMTIFKRFEDHMVGMERKWHLYIEADELDTLMACAKRLERMGLDVSDMHTNVDEGGNNAVIDIKYTHSSSKEEILEHITKDHNIIRAKFVQDE